MGGFGDQVSPHEHHERTTLSQVNPEHCRLVSLKNRRHKGNSAVGSSDGLRSFAKGAVAVEREPVSLERCVDQQQQHREFARCVEQEQQHR